MQITLEVNQLGDKIKECLPDKTLQVIGEVSQPKFFRGNVYLNLKDNYYNIKAIIWKSKYEKFKSEINDGDKIVVKGKLDFYRVSGSVSFIIEKLLKHDGEGELYQLYQKYKKDFEKKGYFMPNQKINISEKIEKVLLLTSENGAAIQDFIYALKNNNSKLYYDIIDVPVQGHNCPGFLITNLLDIQDKYDAIVITRGGGSFEDLFGFSHPELVETVHNFDQPVISAIGHQVDTCLLDLVSDCCCPTPSLAAQYIIDINNKYVRKIENIRNEMKEELLDSYTKQNRELNKCNERLNRIILSFDRIQQSYQNQLLNQLTRYSFKLKELDLKLSTLLNNESSQFSIIKNENNEIIKNVDDFSKVLEDNNNFIIEWNGKQIIISEYDYKINL